MIDGDGKYKMDSKSAHYVSCKAPQKILKVTRGIIKERRTLVSSAIFVVIIEYMKRFLAFPKRAGQGFFLEQF